MNGVAHGFRPRQSPEAAPLPAQGRPKGSGKLGPVQDAIIAKVKAQPDITMPDLAAWLEAEHGVTADPSHLSKLLCRPGFANFAMRARAAPQVSTALSVICRMRRSDFGVGTEGR